MAQKIFCPAGGMVSANGIKENRGLAICMCKITVEEVLDVYKLDLVMPAAMWLIRVEDFPVVTWIATAAACMPRGKPVQNKIGEIVENSLSRLS
jgi:hypothetical protein